QGGKQAEVADGELQLAQAGPAQCLHGEAQHRGVLLLLVRGGEGFDSRLSELGRVRAAGAAGLIAKGEAVVAVARGNVAVRVTGKVQAARRDGEIGAQAQLL